MHRALCIRRRHFTASRLRRRRSVRGHAWRATTHTPVTRRSVNAVTPPRPKQADCSVTFIILCVAVTRHDFCVTPSRLIEGTAARPSYDSPTNCVTGSTTCTRPSRDYNTDTRPSYDSLTTLPRPLRDALRVYKNLILEELLQ